MSYLFRWREEKQEEDSNDDADVETINEFDLNEGKTSLDLDIVQLSGRQHKFDTDVEKIFSKVKNYFSINSKPFRFHP